MGWKHWDESRKILTEEGKRVYYYDSRDSKRDNKEDDFFIGLCPEITENGEQLPCFSDLWKAGSVAVRQWYQLRRGDIRGMDICSCGKHVAIWSAGIGFPDLIKRTIAVYEINYDIAREIMKKDGSWDAYDPDLRRALEKKT